MIRIIEYTTFNGKSQSYPIDIVISEKHAEELRKKLKKKYNVDDVLFSTTTELTKAVKYNRMKPRINQRQKKQSVPVKKRKITNMVLAR